MVPLVQISKDAPIEWTLSLATLKGQQVQALTSQAGTTKTTRFIHESRNFGRSQTLFRRIDVIVAAQAQNTVDRAFDKVDVFSFILKQKPLSERDLKLRPNCTYVAMSRSAADSHILRFRTEWHFLQSNVLLPDV